MHGEGGWGLDGFWTFDSRIQRGGVFPCLILGSSEEKQKKTKDYDV